MLDQFYTKPEVAKQCFDIFCRELSKKINLDEYTFIEPSAGAGAFYNILPSNRRIGLDIHPATTGIIKKNFLFYYPPAKGKYVVIGNPPFGYWTKTARAFIKHCRSFTDYIGFILPVSFSNAHYHGLILPFSVKNFTKLSIDSFILPNGEPYKQGTNFYILNKDKSKLLENCDEYVTVSWCNIHKGQGLHHLAISDYFIASESYSTTSLKMYKDYRKTKNKQMLAIKILKNYDEIRKIILDTDWNKFAFMASCNSPHLNARIIKQVIVDAGFKNKSVNQPKQKVLV